MAQLGPHVSVYDPLEKLIGLILISRPHKPL